MKVEDFDFNLPEKLIAQVPLENRTASRLLVVNPQTTELDHRTFSYIEEQLQQGDCLVLNDTKVLPARLIGEKQDTGAHIEVLLLKQRNGDEWETLVKPAKRVKVGTIVIFGNGLLTATCTGQLEHGGRIFTFQYDGVFYEILDQLGDMPLPPYIHEKLEDRDRYQTVYAKERGSAAAPTAGLHFTTELLERLREKGVQVVFVTLHVGLGTFRPVSVDAIEEHVMHAEFYHIPEDTAATIQQTKATGGKVIAVGTTSTRTLESVARKHNGQVVAEDGWTDIFIYPGYTFQVIDGLITNFHLPKSTLVMLVSALAGKETIMHAYAEAVKEEYRFFSFGDAMYIQPNSEK